MKKRLISLLMALAVISPLAACDPDPTTLPLPINGANGPRELVERGYGPVTYPHDPDTAAFRTECYLSHYAKDDPIMFPGQPGKSHAHGFFGATNADANMTNPREGNSTCLGGTHNSTAYWAPAMVDIGTWDPTSNTFDSVPFISGSYMLPLQTYYKSGYDGVLGRTVTQWFPEGLRMIAGSAASSSPQPLDRISWGCINSGRVDDYYNGIYRRESIPKDCPPGKIIQGTIKFPQCWDGRNLDSPTHGIDPQYPRGANNPANGGVGHMSYARGWPDLGCPASHPVPLPQIEEHFRWFVPANGAANVRLVSDMYNDPRAGMSLHADWWNGWDPEVGQQIIDLCYHPVARDCQMNLFGPAPTSGHRSLADLPPGDRIPQGN